MNTKERKNLKYKVEDKEHFTCYEITDGNTTIELKTNNDGDGLWYKDRQVRGTGFFALPKSYSARMSALKKLFEEYKEF
jgi:cobyric acid synthase